MVSLNALVSVKRHLKQSHAFGTIEWNSTGFVRRHKVDVVMSGLIKNGWVHVAVSAPWPRRDP